MTLVMNGTPMMTVAMERAMTVGTTAPMTIVTATDVMNVIAMAVTRPTKPAWMMATAGMEKFALMDLV
jgi:hypothetical protein